MLASKKSRSSDFPTTCVNQAKKTSLEVQNAYIQGEHHLTIQARESNLTEKLGIPDEEKRAAGQNSRS